MATIKLIIIGVDPWPRGPPPWMRMRYDKDVAAK